MLILSNGFVAAQQDPLRKSLEDVYNKWRHSLQTRNDMVWRQITAEHRQIAVKNRLLSERKKFPADIFNLPALPPTLAGLKHLGTKRAGPTAKAYYYGRIDFGLGNKPAENLLVLSFVGAQNSWKYDQMEYVTLAMLPEVKKQLAKGDIQYIEGTPELLPKGVIPPTPVEVKPAQYIAKVYAYCPGREVRVQVNQTSQHLFQDAQEAQLVIGGAKHGKNQIQYAIKKLIEEDFKDPMTIRIYLFSEVQGVKPIKIYEYLVEDGKKPVEFGKGEFVIDDKVRAKLMGR